MLHKSRITEQGDRLWRNSAWQFVVRWRHCAISQKYFENICLISSFLATLSSRNCCIGTKASRESTSDSHCLSIKLSNKCHCKFLLQEYKCSLKIIIKPSLEVLSELTSSEWKSHSWQPCALSSRPSSWTFCRCTFSMSSCPWLGRSRRTLPFEKSKQKNTEGKMVISGSLLSLDVCDGTAGFLYLTASV